MCARCGKAMSRERPGFNETCVACGRDLHACVNCRFYAPGARWDCAETVEGPVADKERRNLCDWYETHARLLEDGPGDARGRSAGEKARGDFDRLFGGA